MLIGLPWFGAFRRAEAHPPAPLSATGSRASFLRGAASHCCGWRNTLRAAEHAREIGLISGRGVDEVRREVERQERERGE